MTKRATNEDGVDITEGVQILYDIAHSSMDWGSGFLSNEEMETVVRLAIVMGWGLPDLPDSEPMATVAQKFPEHYTVEWITYPAAQTTAGHTFPERRHARIRKI